MRPIDRYKGETAASGFISIRRYYIIHKVLVEQIAQASFCLESARVRETQRLGHKAITSGTRKRCVS